MKIILKLRIIPYFDLSRNKISITIIKIKSEPTHPRSTSSIPILLWQESINLTATRHVLTWEHPPKVHHHSIPFWCWIMPWSSKHPRINLPAHSFLVFRNPKLFIPGTFSHVSVLPYILVLFFNPSDLGDKHFFLFFWAVCGVRDLIVFLVWIWDFFCVCFCGATRW